MTNINGKLKNFLGKIALEQGYKNYTLNINPITTDGANYSSILYKAKISENNKSDLDLFIKVIVECEKMREQFELKTFEAERYMYTTIKNIFTEIEDKNNVAPEDRLVLTKYYGAHTIVREEMLVLEDLTAKGFSTYDRQKSVDWAYASAAVRELAKFHALAMAFQKEYPEEHDRFCRDYFTDWITQEAFNSFMKNGFDKAVEIVKDENKEALKKFYDNLDLQKVRDMHDPCRKPVLIHMDYRASNLMHRQREDASVEIIPIDLQTPRAGCVVTDLLYFIITGTDEEFRRLNYQRLIDHYYTELSAAMTRLGVESSYYSKDDFDHELKERLPYGLLVAGYTLPVVTVDTEDAPKLEEGIDMAAFGNCKVSTLYFQRLNGIVDDYVRWGVI